MIQLNGIAHIQLTVRDVVRSRPFYHRVLHELLGMVVQYDTPEVFYCIGGRTGVLIRSAAEQNKDIPFDQWRIGLHHFCFRVKEREDIDALHKGLIEMGAKVVHAPEDGPWAPGYYSVLFEDPDGIRLEANYIPGAGNLAVIKDKPLDPPRG